jgi:hypothetical protein
MAVPLAGPVGLVGKNAFPFHSNYRNGTFQTSAVATIDCEQVKIQSWRKHKHTTLSKAVTVL